MNKVHTYFSAIKNDFAHWLEESSKQTLEFDWVTATALLVFATIAALIAIFTFVNYGYHWAFLEINAQSASIAPAILHHITVFGDGILILSLLLIIANRNAALQLATLISGVSGAIVTQSLKRYFNAERPPAALEPETFNLIGQAYSTLSFPSGHTLTAFLVATVLICFSRRRSTKLLLLAAATSVGLSRIWLGVHWPIDALVGAALGIATGLASVFFSIRWVKSIHPAWILFALFLLVLACIIALSSRNDYYYAQLFIYAVAAFALYKTVKQYLLLPILLEDSNSTRNYLKENSHVVFFVVLLLISIYRILVISQEHFALFYDEAYYYHWSLTPDFGYYSKPPVVAWLIYLTTSLFGTSVLSVKLASPLLYSATAYIIYKTGCLIKQRENGVIAGLVFLTAPVVGFNSEFITTDAPLLFFWSLSFYLFILALTSEHLKYWILLGVSVGLGMLSKYTMAVLPASLFLFLLMTPKQRKVLLNYRPWLAAIIAGLIFSTNLFWNAQHDWISFQHTQEISNQENSGINIYGLFEFLLAQVFVLGPLWIWAFFRVKPGQIFSAENTYSFASRAALVSSIGILAVIGLQALSSHAFPNWAAPWTIGAALLLGLGMDFSKRNSRFIRNACIAHLILLSTFYHWPQVLQTINVEASRKNNPFQRLEGWEEVAEQLRPIIARYPDAKLASNSRDLLAYLGFHAMLNSIEFARWNPDTNNVRDHYDLKFNLREYTNEKQAFIYIAKTPLMPYELARFKQAASLGKLKHDVFYDLKREIYVYHLVGFKGYE